MRKANTLLLLWLAFISAVLAVSEVSGTSDPIASRGLGPVQSAGAVSAVGIVPNSNAGNTGNMLQFKAIGHVLGFQANKVFVAGLDHALSVEFLGTDGVTPTCAPSVPTAGNDRKALPLSMVTYRNLWDGIDLTYEPAHGGIAESTYRVAPGADPSRIRLRYNVPVEPQGDGSLKLKFERGALTESPPVAWQEIEGNRVPVMARFRVSGNELGFAVGPYDHSQPLVIDPTYAWHTFFGEGHGELGLGIALDADGNIYVTGYAVFSWGSPLHPHSGSADIVVLKFDKNGACQWHTFYGSSTSRGHDMGLSIALDGSGNIYVTGVSGDWGSPLHAHSGSLNGLGDLFVLKLDNNGAYQWHTFFGSPEDDVAEAIAVDSGGSAYVTGYSGDWGSPINAHSGGLDVYALKLDGDGNYQWHTFFGSSEDDVGTGIALDTSGKIYLTGGSSSTWGFPLNVHSDSGDILVLKLDNTGSYQWHTFHGSSAADGARGIALDILGNIYVTGTSAGDWGSPLHSHSGSNDIVVLKLDSQGAYLWHTFYGSSRDDYSSGVALDGTGNVYLTGGSQGNWGSPMKAYSGAYDVFIMKLDSDGALLWNTFYGSATFDHGNDIAVRSSGDVYVAGNSDEVWGTPLNPPSNSGNGLVLMVPKEAPDLGALTVMIDPHDAFWGGAQWRLVGGTWQYGGATVSGIPEGIHTVEFKVVDGWDKPADLEITIVKNKTATASGTYVRQMGTLTVGITPQFAIDAGAQWRVDGGLWQNSGAAVSRLGVGQHTVEFSALPGWVKPQDQTVTIVKDQGVQTSGTYTLLPSIGRIDFNGDTRGDILWRHTSGALSFWQMNGLTVQAVNTTPAVDPSWQVAALADFNGDGRCDILWRHTGGMLYTWMMHGASAIADGSPGSVDPSWSVAGAADFGGDGRADILWRHTSGALTLWQMDGIKALKVVTIPPVDVSWQVKALADFNGDGRADILWRHTGGMLYIWLMNGSTAIDHGSPGNMDLGWTITSAADFTGDRKADILWRHTNGATVIWQMDGVKLLNPGPSWAVDPSWMVDDTPDFNGDGMADILWRHTSGATSLWLMNGFTRIGEGSLGGVDPSWKIENQ